MPVLFYILPALFAFASARTSSFIGTVSDFKLQPAFASCDWFGNAPDCDGRCPTDFIEVRVSSNQFLTNGVSNYTDPTFGEICASGTKSFCCKPETNNCHWHGMWVNSLNQKYTCSVHLNPNGYSCANVVCNSHSSGNLKTSRSTLDGQFCDKIELFGLFGIGTCGSIHWKENKTSETVVDSWYKVL